MFNRRNTKSINMKLSTLAAAELLSYSTILENIITTNLQIQGEIKEAVEKGFCEKQAIEPIFMKSINAQDEADTIYEAIQKELDLRVKKDLGMKFGIRRTQSIIKELDAFVAGKNKESKAAQEREQEDAKRISSETIGDLKVVQDADL
jgi:hypothetical protein